MDPIFSKSINTLKGWEEKLMEFCKFIYKEITRFDLELKPNYKLYLLHQNPSMDIGEEAFKTINSGYRRNDAEFFLCEEVKYSEELDNNVFSEDEPVVYKVLEQDERTFMTITQFLMENEVLIDLSRGLFHFNKVDYFELYILTQDIFKPKKSDNFFADMENFVYLKFEIKTQEFLEFMGIKPNTETIRNTSTNKISVKKRREITLPYIDESKSILINPRNSKEINVNIGNPEMKVYQMLMSKKGSVFEYEELEKVSGINNSSLHTELHKLISNIRKKFLFRIGCTKKQCGVNGIIKNIRSKGYKIE